MLNTEENWYCPTFKFNNFIVYKSKVAVVESQV